MKFTKKAFSEWLDSKGDRQLVGKPEHPNACPLCEFLWDQEIIFAWVDLDNWRVGGGALRKIPLWAKKFQEAACAHVGLEVEKKITAGTAKKLLAQV